MRVHAWAGLLLAGFLVWLVTSAYGQSALLAAPVVVADWGLSRIDEVRYGEWTKATGAGGQEAYLVALSDHPPAAPGPEPSPVTALRRAPSPTGRACWVWTTSKLLADPDATDACLDFLEQQGVTRVFLQVPPVFDEPLAALVGRFRERGFTVEALDGDKSFTLRARHAEVLARLGQLIEWQASQPEGRRFQGVHYDIEPYLLPGFGGARRDEYLQQYVELVGQLSELSARAQLPLGLDIPVWYSYPSELTGRVSTAAWKGVTKPVYQHLIDLSAEVALMDYRTQTERVVESARLELAYAGSRGRRVWVGLETSPLPDEETFVFQGAPESGLGPEGGERIVWVGDAAEGRGRMLRLRPEQREQLQAQATGQVVWSWPVTTVHRTPASSLSFAGSSCDRLDLVLQQVGEQLAVQAGFAGMAVHSYESWRTLADSEH